MAEWSKAVVSGTIHYLARVQIPLASRPFLGGCVKKVCEVLPKKNRVVQKFVRLKKTSSVQLCNAVVK